MGTVFRAIEPAVIREVSGVVKFGDVTKSHRKALVVAPDGEEHEYQVPPGAHVNVREGEAVVAGDPLMDGPIDPHDILKVMGADERQHYPVDEIQEVYPIALSRSGPMGAGEKSRFSTGSEAACPLMKMKSDFI